MLSLFQQQLKEGFIQSSRTFEPGVSGKENSGESRAKKRKLDPEEIKNSQQHWRIAKKSGWCWWERERKGKHHQTKNFLKMLPVLNKDKVEWKKEKKDNIFTPLTGCHLFKFETAVSQMFYSSVRPWRLSVCLWATNSRFDSVLPAKYLE